MSSLEGVTGRSLSKDSTSHRKVQSASSVNMRSSVMTFNAIFIEFISDFQAPPIHGLLGGLKFQEK